MIESGLTWGDMRTDYVGEDSPDGGSKDRLEGGQARGCPQLREHGHSLCMLKVSRSSFVASSTCKQRFLN
jgi:hypothetical protein